MGTAAARGFDGDLDIFFDALLADVFVEALGADAGFDAQVFVNRLAGDNAIGLPRRHHSFCAGVSHVGENSNTEFAEARAQSAQRNRTVVFSAVSVPSPRTLC